jgi:hypothetical protein
MPAATYFSEISGGPNFKPFRIFHRFEGKGTSYLPRFLP